jgi:microsomal dipeptidase-like Zn-dependent dipeptidase
MSRKAATVASYPPEKTIHQSLGIGSKTLNYRVTASDMNGADRLHVLADALERRRYSDAAIEKILGGNFVRVFGAACD